MSFLHHSSTVNGSFPELKLSESSARHLPHFSYNTRHRGRVEENPFPLEFELVGLGLEFELEPEPNELPAPLLNPKLFV